MGRDAKAKAARWAAGQSVARGNPEPSPLMATVISAKKHREAVKAKKQLRAKFSDREYAMDAKGQLRRLRPTPSTVATMTFHGPATT